MLGVVRSSFGQRLNWGFSCIGSVQFSFVFVVLCPFSVRFVIVSCVNQSVVLECFIRICKYRLLVLLFMLILCWKRTTRMGDMYTPILYIKCTDEKNQNVYGVHAQ